MARSPWRGSQGTPKATDSRLELLAAHMRSHKDWKDRLQFNEFRNHSEILNGHDVLEPVGDLHVIQTTEKLQRSGFIHARSMGVREAINLVAAERPYHPIRDWLDGLKWDGIDRLDHWLVQCLGCDDTVYVRAIGRMFPISMVARVMKPGCQADYMLVLEGEQGIYKSTICRILAGPANFGYLPPKFDTDPVRASMSLRGKWLLEVAELEAFSGEKTESLKAFITQPIENYTPKYGHYEVHEPRQCLLIGTTNRDQYLSDPTGGRRFWPVLTREIDPDALTGMREQLFAEAVHRYRAKEPYWPDAAFEAKHIKPQQDARRETEPWAEIIRPWLATQGSHKIALVSVWKDCLFGRIDAYDHKVRRSLGRAMRECGWDIDITDSAKKWKEKTIFPPP